MRQAIAAGALLALFCCGPLAAQPLPLWQLDGEHNTIYLLGSVHLLRENDYPLPAGMTDAYEDAETLIMEIDMDDLDAQEAQALTRRLGVLESGTLGSALGAQRYQRAQQLAARASIPLQQLSSLEPWLAAISVEQLLLARAGFTASHGVESHFARLAATDSKEILGLETFGEQLGLLDALPADAQAALLLQTLEESLDFEQVMDRLVAAWLRGDVASLERAMLADMQAYPVLYSALVVDRNRNWVQQLQALLDDEDDYLVIVGTLHLVGPDGVPALLRQKGYPVRQLMRTP